MEPERKEHPEHRGHTESDRDRMKDEDRLRREEGIEETGRKGGAASMAGGMPYARETTMEAGRTRDLVRWGPIWAGLLVALAVQLLLGAVGLAVALRAYDPSVANYGERVSSTLGIWSAISALIALFIGGYVAGRMAAVSGFKNGFAQGSIVWALSLVVGTILSALGAAGFLGAALNIQPLLRQGIQLSGPEAMNLIRATSSGAWWFVIGSILAWAAAAGGGVLGASARYEEVSEEMR